jgi:hypothetical protein
MFFCWFLPFLYTTSYTILYTTSYTILFTTLYVKYTISYTKYTISYSKYTISYTTYVFVAGSCHFCIRRRIRYRIKIAMSYTICNFSSLLYDIVRTYRMPCRYYTILYVHIAKNIRCYSTMSHTIFLTSTWTGVCGGSHWPCPWSAHRSSLMILGPPRWSVLHCDSPDTLSLSLACATANVSGHSDSLIGAKMGISS